MIYEIRSYTLDVGDVDGYVNQFRDWLKNSQKYYRVRAFFRTEFGPLSQVVMIYAYENLGERDEIRAAAGKDPLVNPHLAPPDIPRIQRIKRIPFQTSEILIPAPFMRPLEAGHYGNIYEMRIYRCRELSFPEMMRRWGELMPKRERYSRCVLCGYTDLGELYKVIHIWPYESMEQRARVRREAVENGDWPPNDQEFILSMENRLLVPADFSPVR
jgi:hypothetical protein